jgi:hypothetical protein
VIEIEPFGPVGEEQLGDIERALGAPLPGPYRDFLARTGGGWAARPNHIAGVGYELIVFLGVTDDPGYQLVSAQRTGYAEILPPEVIVVAYADAGQVCLQVAGDGTGRVLWLSEDAWDDVPPGETSWEPLRPVAGDFSGFLEEVLLPGDPPEEGP